MGRLLSRTWVSGTQWSGGVGKGMKVRLFQESLDGRRSSAWWRQGPGARRELGSFYSMQVLSETSLSAILKAGSRLYKEMMSCVGSKKGLQGGGKGHW